MSNLEDAWQKITASDEYNNYSDEIKTKVKQRFFERTIGASQQYKLAVPEMQRKIQSRFEERLNPSMLSKVEKDVKDAGTVVKATGGVGEVAKEAWEMTPMHVAAKKVGELGHEFVQGIDQKDTKSIPGKAGSLVAKGVDYVAGTAEDVGDPKTALDPAEGNRIMGAAGGAVAKEMIKGLVPESEGGAVATVAAEPALEIAKGLPILGADVGKMAESFIGKFRGLKTLPPVRMDTPLQGLLDDEKAYEAKLMEMTKMNGNPLYEPFTPQFKTNMSQLREYHQEQLINTRAEDPHLKQLAQSEEDVAYQKKLESMPGAESYKKQPPLIPFKGMLQGGKEGMIRQPPKPKIGVSDVIKPEIRNTLENIAGMDKPKQPFMEEAWKNKAEGEGVDPDVKKFKERNLSDITQKPGRNILKELNDDLGHIGSIRFGPSNEDPDVLQAAKDLRVAVKMENGKIFKDKFGADSHSQVTESAKTAKGATEGFWDELTSKFYSREDAAKMLGWADQRIKQTGGLMAQNLRDLHDNWAKLGEKGEVSLGGNLPDDVKVRVRKAVEDKNVAFDAFGAFLEKNKDLKTNYLIGNAPEFLVNYLKDHPDLQNQYYTLEKTARTAFEKLNEVQKNVRIKYLGEKGEISIGAGGRFPVRPVGHDDYDVLNAAKDLRVAAKKFEPDGTFSVHVGNFGDTHADAFSGKLYPNVSSSLDNELVARHVELGFYDNLTKKFISRDEAASYLGPKYNTLLGEELGDLHRAGITYLGKAEKGLHSEDIAKIKANVSGQIIKQINKEFGEKGHIWADADPERYDRIKQNIRELLRRAHVVGYDATDEVIAFAERNFVSKEELHFMKDELGKEETAPLDPRPISEVLQAAAGQRDAKNTLWEKVKDRWSPDGTASKVKTLLTKRYGEIAEGHVDSQYFIHNTLKQLTKAEREAMAFKGVAPNPESFRWPNNKEILKLISKPTENMKKADKALTTYMAEAHNFLSENFDDVGYVKDYVTQLWDKPSDVLLNPAKNEAGTYNPFLQKRSFPNYAAGINAGQQPKTLDIREIASVYDKYKIKTVANVRFFEELAKMPTPQGLPAVMDARRAPMGWVRADNVPALVGKRVHPDYLGAVKVITDAPFSNKALRAYDLLAESQRYASLTLSPFHFGSLFINSSLSTDLPFKIPLKVLATTGKYIMKEALADKSEASIWAKVLSAYKEGHAAFIDLPQSKRAVRAGLNIGMIGKQQIGGLENFLMGTEAKLNKFYLGKGIKAVRGAMDILNKPMWDYAHAGIKIMTFQEHLLDNMKKFPDMPIQELERKTASYVNDLDSGEAWETLFISPQYQKALHRLLFFPDWMVSRLRTLGEVFKPVGLDSFKNATTRSPEAYQAQKFWLRAGLEYYTFANWRNYVNTKKAYGKGRFMWDNDPGKEMDVFSHSDEHGRAIYHNYAPAITEVFKWFQSPIKALGARFNPNLQLMAEFFTGTTLSGYKLPENKRSFAQIAKRHFATPIVLGGNNEYGLFPGSKGMSSYDVVKRFEGVIKNGDDPSIAIQYGTQNGYDIEKLYNIAMRNVRGKMRKELVAP